MVDGRRRKIGWHIFEICRFFTSVVYAWNIFPKTGENSLDHFGEVLKALIFDRLYVVRYCWDLNRHFLSGGAQSETCSRRNYWMLRARLLRPSALKQATHRIPQSRARLLSGFGKIPILRKYRLRFSKHQPCVLALSLIFAKTTRKSVN